MDSNQSGASGGIIWVPFHLSRESLKPLKWPWRPDIAKIKPGFVDFGLGWSWRVHEMLQYLCFDNIQTLGQLGSEINVKCVIRPRICVFCLLHDSEWNSFHCPFSCWLSIKTPRKCIFRTWNILFAITEDKRPPPHKLILEFFHFYRRLTVLFPCVFFSPTKCESVGGSGMS